MYCCHASEQDFHLAKPLWDRFPNRIPGCCYQVSPRIRIDEIKSGLFFFIYRIFSIRLMNYFYFKPNFGGIGVPIEYIPEFYCQVRMKRCKQSSSIQKDLVPLWDRFPNRIPGCCYQVSPRIRIDGTESGLLLFTCCFR